MFSQCLAVFIKKAPPLLFLLNMPIFFSYDRLAVTCVVACVMFFSLI